MTVIKKLASVAGGCMTCDRNYQDVIVIGGKNIEIRMCIWCLGQIKDMLFISPSKYRRAKWRGVE